MGGDTLAIPLTHAMVRKTTGGAEALTLADGFAGQMLTITLVSHGGDGTLVPANRTGFSSVVLGAVKDTVTLRFVDCTVGWVIVGTAGVAGPPAIS